MTNVDQNVVNTKEKEAQTPRTPRTPGEYISLSNQFSKILFSILTENKKNKKKNKNKKKENELSWKLLMNIPSIYNIKKLIELGMQNDVEWEKAMQSGSDLYSVYIFQMIDTLLSPASVQNITNTKNSKYFKSEERACNRVYGKAL